MFDGGDSDRFGRRPAWGRRPPAMWPVYVTMGLMVLYVGLAFLVVGVVGDADADLAHQIQDARLGILMATLALIGLHVYERWRWLRRQGQWRHGGGGA